MEKQKHIICSVIVALRSLKYPLPSRDAVLGLRATKTNYKEALAMFLDAKKLSGAGEAAALSKEIREWSVALRDYDDAQFKKKFPDVHDLVSIVAPGSKFTGKIKPDDVPAPPAAPIDTKAKGVLLDALNRLLVMQKKKPLKSWKESIAKLNERLALEKRRIETKEVAITKLPTVVAKGAYKSDEEAVRSTGHTMHGKTASMVKEEKRKERIIAKRVDPTPVRSAPRAAQKRAGHDGLITLADIARDLKMLPKVARAKARRHTKELAALEVAHYKYKPEHQERVKAILEKDSRKK